MDVNQIIISVHLSNVTTLDMVSVFNWQQGTHLDRVRRMFLPNIMTYEICFTVWNSFYGPKKKFLGSPSQKAAKCILVIDKKSLILNQTLKYRQFCT